MEKWYKHALPLVGEKCYEVHHGRSEPCQPCPAYRTMLTGEPHFETIPLKGDDGRSVGWADVHAFPWLSKTTGKLKGVIKYIRDITYRVEAEQTVEESLNNLQKALNGTVKALGQHFGIERPVYGQPSKAGCSTRLRPGPGAGGITPLYRRDARHGISP